MTFLLLVLGIGLLYLGGEALVSGSSQLAKRLGISPLVIGLTVVAFGTSSPELAATFAAVLQNEPQVALGNIIGSNSANIGLILGLSVLIYTVAYSRSFIRRDMVLMLLSGVALGLVLLDGRINRFEGFLLLSSLTAYVIWMFKTSPADGDELDKTQLWPLWKSVGASLLGLVLLVVGARALVSASITLATSLGIPPKVIGLTLVAVGTSLPELTSSLIAAMRKQGDLILGNIIGSNIFNILGILGVTCLVKPIHLGFQEISIDFIIMMAFSVLLLILMLMKPQLGKVGGVILLSGYIVYVAWLYLYV